MHVLEPVAMGRILIGSSNGTLYLDKRRSIANICKQGEPNRIIAANRLCCPVPQQFCARWGLIPAQNQFAGEGMAIAIPSSTFGKLGFALGDHHNSLRGELSAAPNVRKCQCGPFRRSSVRVNGATSMRPKDSSGAVNAYTIAARTMDAWETTIECPVPLCPSIQCPTRQISSRKDSPPWGVEPKSESQEASPEGSSAWICSSERPLQAP